MSSTPTPRLHLTARYRNGTQESLGDFADGPRGRKEAARAFEDSYEQNRALDTLISMDYSDYRSGDGEHPHSGALLKDIKIERRFTDGTQQLLRVPDQAQGRVDEYPGTFKEAELLEAKRAKAFCRRDFGVLSSEPLTGFEDEASRGKQADPTILDLVEQVHAKHRAEERAKLLDSVLPPANAWKPPEGGFGAEARRQIDAAMKARGGEGEVPQPRIRQRF